MKKRKTRRRIELVIMLLLFIPSSIYIIYDLEANWKNSKDRYNKEKVEYKRKSFQEVSEIMSFLSYVPQKYDKAKEIIQLSYEKKINPIVIYNLQAKLQADYFIFSKNKSNLLIVDKKNNNIIDAFETLDLKSFLRDNNLPSNIETIKGYKSGDKYYFLEPSINKNVSYMLTIDDSFFELNTDSKRFGKWYFIYNNKVINGLDKKNNEKIIKELNRRHKMNKDLKVYFKEVNGPNSNSIEGLLKLLTMYLIVNLVFLVIITKLLVNVAYEPLKRIVENISSENETKGDVIKYIDDAYKGLKAENELLKETNNKTTEYMSKKSLVDYFKGFIKFETVEHPLKDSECIYRVLIGKVRIHEYSDDQVVSFKQDMDKKMKNYDGESLLLDRGIIALIIKNDKVDIEALKLIFEEFNVKYDVEIMGFLSEKDYRIKDLYNKYNFFMRFLDYKFKLKEKVIISEKDINQNTRDYYYPIRVEQKIINRVMDKNIVTLKNIYKGIYEENFEIRKISSRKFEKLKVLMSNSFRRIQEDIPREKRVEEGYFINIIASSNEKELKISIDEIISALFGILPEPKENANDIVNKKIDEFIKQNYAKEISLLDFAEYMGVTLQYASNLYKKVKNETFNKSLRKYRVDKSLELYKENKNLKIKELSVLVGYSNTMTFINNFKKEKGMSPGKFFVENM